LERVNEDGEEKRGSKNNQMDAVWRDRKPEAKEKQRRSKGASVDVGNRDRAGEAKDGRREGGKEDGRRERLEEGREKKVEDDEGTEGPFIRIAVLSTLCRIKNAGGIHGG